LPERYGHWNSVWKRFSRLSKAGVFEIFFEHLASLSTSADLVQRCCHVNRLTVGCVSGWS
ncbi:transposase, partial [Agrobacterium vitis]|nr:transposase [Allorhizobium ampelinum]